MESPLDRVVADIRAEHEAMLPLAQRCAYWLRGEQCPAERVDGSRYCALHDAGRRFAA